MESVADHFHEYDDGNLDDVYRALREKLRPYRDHSAADSILLFDSFLHIASVSAKSGTDMRSPPDSDAVRSRLESFLELPVFDLLLQADALLADARK